MKLVNNMGASILLDISQVTHNCNLQKYLFLSKLAKKYSVSIFLTSMAKNKHDLLSYEEVLSYAKKLKIPKKNIANFASFL